MSELIYETNFTGLGPVRRGKVRDIYDLGKYYLIVTTDRVSAFDVIFSDPIPGKGEVLNEISIFWFRALSEVIPNHFVTDDVWSYPSECSPYYDILRGRSMLVKKADPFPTECIVRGFLSGSGWKSYKKNRSVCGIGLPPGLVESDRLQSPIFTPSTKEEKGHDINISFDEMVGIVGKREANYLKERSLALYERGAKIASDMGIIVADTKFEFGKVDGSIILIDEAITPDSSRYWPKATYSSGGPQQSLDKQYLRDYLLGTGWDQNPPAPKLPQDIIETLSKKYQDLYKIFWKSRFW